MKHASAQQNAAVAVFARHQDAEEAVSKIASSGFGQMRFMQQDSTPMHPDEAHLFVLLSRF